MTMARGGKRKPANPAPVSGPGALSRRTDGGPGQPVRLAPDQPYGQRKRSAELQKAAPLAAGAASPAPPPGAGGQPPSPSPTPDGGGVFGPTRRPQEPPNAGLNSGPGALPPDPDALIRVLYSMYPHPDLARLIGYDQSP